MDEDYNIMACPWCGNEVVDDGDVCDLDCYSIWHAWMSGSDASDLLVLTDDDRVVVLADDGGWVKSLEEQPWYQEMVEAA